MTQRLRQFWNFGHNCAILGLTLELAEQVLEDNRFTPYALTAEEKDHFVHGLYHTPHLWHRNTLKPIDIRPIICEPLQHTKDRQEYRQRALRCKPTVHSRATRDKIKMKNLAYWSSPAGDAMKAKLSRDRKAEFLQRGL